jgi:hypothetical protein
VLAAVAKASITLKVASAVAIPAVKRRDPIDVKDLYDHA